MSPAQTETQGPRVVGLEPYWCVALKPFIDQIWLFQILALTKQSFHWLYIDLRKEHQICIYLRRKLRRKIL